MEIPGQDGDETGRCPGAAGHSAEFAEGHFSPSGQPCSGPRIAVPLPASLGPCPLEALAAQSPAGPIGIQAAPRSE